MFRSGYVAIIGRPNAGKSTLLNALLDFKLSIVSPKPQTTRRRVIGIANESDAQMIFLDTPGLIDPRYALQEKMMAYAIEAVDAADVLLPIVDVSGGTTDLLESLRPLVERSGKPAVLLLNKVDLIAKDSLLPLMAACHETGLFKEMIPISALHKDGIPQVKQAVARYLPEHPPYYDPELMTEQPERFFVTEIIREKIFHHFSEEVPYSTDVVIEEFKERKNRKDYVKAQIIVERPSQKAILIGRKGQALKSVGEEARKDIEEFLGRPVYLELWVKVQEKWRDSEKLLRRLGYE